VKISVLCVTRGEPHSERFLRHFALVAKFLGAEFVVGADRAPHVQALGGKVVPVDCSSCPAVETVLEEAVAVCSGDWILRLDDDESVSLAMLYWMMTFDFSRGEAVAFPRAHLWGDEATAMTNPGYWPDWQMRLSLRKWAVRKVLHEPAARIDIVAPACLLHHVYLVRDRAARKECAERYCKIQGVPMPDPPTYWPSDYLSVETSPIFDGAAIVQ
jgi:hypothetical protein